jgi:dTMP kinase
VKKNFFGKPPAGVDPKKLQGALIVIEGMDSSGRSTHINNLVPWLEQKGYSVVSTGLKRSLLVSEELETAKNGNVLSPRTMSLFYATDFYDQLENNIIPALNAGCVVLADRYIFTMMIRDIVRGAEKEWVSSLYQMALIPDAVFFLDISIKTLVDRTLRSNPTLDYWESGMDMGFSRDWFDSMIKYQNRVKKEFMNISKDYNFDIVNANRTAKSVGLELRAKIEKVIEEVMK